MVIFIELVQYAKNPGRKSRKNLVEHPIVKITHSVCYVGPYRLTMSKLGATNSYILEQNAE